MDTKPIERLIAALSAPSASSHVALGFTPASRALYCRPDGTPKRVGDRVVNRELGQTLRLIAKHGDEVFYEGEIAHAIVEDMRKHDGLIAAAGAAIAVPSALQKSGTNLSTRPSLPGATK